MDIDIVLPWVDNEDPDWQAAYHQWLPANTEGLDVSEPRYRNWHLLRYWFRGVEQFAPWVRKIHFVTNGQLPSWLNTEHPKLHIVRHSDILPADALPCFSSHPLELNMHRIEGLAEHFVYFNDDIFLTAPTVPTDFFHGDLPVDMAVTKPKEQDATLMNDIIDNNLKLINSRFHKWESMLCRPLQWFHLSYRGFLRLTFNSLFDTKFESFLDPHVPQPYKLNTFEEVWGQFPVELNATTHHRFRSREDVNQWLFRYWRLANGEFYPKNVFHHNAVFFYPQEQWQELVRVVKSPTVKIVTINDTDRINDFDAFAEKTRALFIDILPKTSSFEIA